MEEPDESEPSPPTAEKVARRAIILSVISCRGFTDGDPDPEAANLAQRSFHWLRALDLEGELSEWEQQILASPFGTLTERDRMNVGWLSEAVTVLAWALGKIEMPAFDEQCEPSDVANSLGFLQPTADTVLNDPQLRSTEEFQDYNNFIYNLHWRVRDYSLHQRSYDFESLARKAWGEPLLRYGLKLKEEDLCLTGVPLARASESDWRNLSSITQERHRASNWLIGYESEDFYLVTTDT